MRRIVYVCHTFPWVTQTFTTREVELLRAAGVAVEVVAFREPRGELLDQRARALLPVTTYVPAFATSAFAGPVVRMLVRHPWPVLRALARGAAASYLAKTTIALRARGVADALRGIWLAGTRSDESHFHAEFAENAATAVMVAHELTGRTFSFKSHSSYNPQLLRSKARRAAFIALATEFDRDFYFSDVPAERILVNRLGVESVDIRPRDVESGGPVRVLSVATLSEKKGQSYLIEAIASLVGQGMTVHCIIVGDGPRRHELEQEAAALGVLDQIEFQPYIPNDKLEELYRAADIFALPAVVTPEGDRDGLPVVLMEAAAAGCVCIATPVSGIPELIDDEVSGLLVPERDAAALASAIVRIATDKELRERLREGARAILKERFDLRRNVAELAQAFLDQSAEAGFPSTSK